MSRKELLLRFTKCFCFKVVIAKLYIVTLIQCGGMGRVTSLILYFIETLFPGLKRKPTLENKRSTLQEC